MILLFHPCHETTDSAGEREWEGEKKPLVNTMQCVNQSKDEGHQIGTYRVRRDEPLLRLHGNTKSAPD